MILDVIVIYVRERKGPSVFSTFPFTSFYNDSISLKPLLSFPNLTFIYVCLSAYLSEIVS